MGNQPKVQQGDADQHREESDTDPVPDDPDSGDDDGALGISMPALSRKHAAIGLVVILAILLYLRYTRGGGSGNANTGKRREEVGLGEPEDDDTGVDIEPNPNDPLEQDDQYIQESGAFDSLVREDDE